MTDRRGCRSAQGLDQGGLCIRDLVRSRLTPQLECRFDSLVHARRASSEAARLHASHRGTGDFSSQTDFFLFGKLPSLTFRCESNGFQLQGGVDAEYIVIFEKVDTLQ